MFKILLCKTYCLFFILLAVHSCMVFFSDGIVLVIIYRKSTISGEMFVWFFGRHFGHLNGEMNNSLKLVSMRLLHSIDTCILIFHF